MPIGTPIKYKNRPINVKLAKTSPGRRKERKNVGRTSNVVGLLAACVVAERDT